MIDPISLEVFRHRCSAIAEEMGAALGRTALSANIKERRDYSCAVFDSAGRMVAQAAHIPVHLGAMPRSVEAALAAYHLEDGDVVVLNDPAQGGTHLPDITTVSAVMVDGAPLAYVATRAHHADVGGMAPGSMPMARELVQEGLIIPPVLLVRRGVRDEGVLALICRNSRTPDERRGDLAAQLACHSVGTERLRELAAALSPQGVAAHMAALIAAGERWMRSVLAALPDGTYRAEDVLDDDGTTGEPVRISVAITIAGERAQIDFDGTAAARPGPINAPLAVAESAVLYAFRCLGPAEMLTNAGTQAPLTISAPAGSVINPPPGMAVSGGNVETSQRVVDVLLEALAQAAPERIPAASCGTMNNWTAGGVDTRRGRSFAYYETLGGGMGARPELDGLSAIQVHMTNTLNTPVEAFEHQYPMQVRRYAIRRGSGGAGRRRGGDGLVREIAFLEPATITLLTERRRHRPPGLSGGADGAAGRNTLITPEGERELPGKITLEIPAGAALRIETPGGGGYGSPQEHEHERDDAG